MRANERAAVENGSIMEVRSHSPVSHAFMVEENKIRAEAEAWVRKYFVEASIARGCGNLVMRGIIARVLISSPIQAKSQ